MSLRELKALQTKKWKEYMTVADAVEKHNRQKSLAQLQKKVGKYYQRDNSYYSIREVSQDRGEPTLTAFSFTLYPAGADSPFECGFHTFYLDTFSDEMKLIPKELWNEKLDVFFDLLNQATE